MERRRGDCSFSKKNRKVVRTADYMDFRTGEHKIFLLAIKEKKHNIGFELPTSRLIDSTYPLGYEETQPESNSI